VLGGEKADTISDDINGNGCVGPKEPIWETAVLEESSCNVHVELPAIIATVDKECEGKDRLGVCGEDSGRSEAELGIGGDGILDSLEPEFCGHREVVKTGTKLVTEGGELVKERLIEAVVVPEKEISSCCTGVSFEHRMRVKPTHNRW